MKGKPVIHDCFTYNGEEDLLWLRLETLKDTVSRFVIAEATRTFTGRPKPLRFDPTRFRTHENRIHYIVVDDLNEKPSSAWENEYSQRNALARGVLSGTALSEDEWVVLSDVDEIPRPEALLRFDPDRYYSALLEQRLYYYALNNQEVISEANPDPWWRKARVTTAKRLRSRFKTMQGLRDGYRPAKPFRKWKRSWEQSHLQVIPDAGWHFSYLMTPDQIVEKLRAFSHQEFNVPDIANVDYIRQRFAQGKSLFNDAKFSVVQLDDSFPAPLLLNRSRFASRIW